MDAVQLKGRSFLTLKDFTKEEILYFCSMEDLWLHRDSAFVHWIFEWLRQPCK